MSCVRFNIKIGSNNCPFVDGMLKVTTKGGKTYEGEIFAVDPVTKAMVLKNESTYLVLNPNQITNIDGALVLPQDPSFTQYSVR